MAKASGRTIGPEAPTEESVLRGLDRWWFGFGSATSLGLFRLLIGAIAVLNLLSTSGDLPWWYGENGFVPAWLGQAWFGTKVPSGLGFDVPKLSLIGGVTDYRLVVAFYVLAVVLAVLTALGLFTRFSAFALGLCLISIHHRNPIILHGGDTALRVAVIYLMVSPCGRACSLDRLIALRRGKEDGPPTISLWPQRLVQYNSALIYFTTVWAKWFGLHWMDGTATWYPVRLAEFQRFPVPSFLNEFPMVYVATYGTLLIEFSLGTLVFFRPLRKFVLLGGVMLHAYIEYAMNVPFFSFLMVSFYVCHFDGEEIADYCRRLGDRARSVAGLEVTLPAGRRLTAAGERFLSAVDPFGLVRYLPGERWGAVKDNGKPAHPFRGVAYRAPGAWVLLVVPGLWRRTMLASTEAA